MRNFNYVVLCLTALTAAGCSDDEIDSDEAACRAYLALDGSIEKSIALGFAGFNAATSANIDPQTGGPASILVGAPVDANSHGRPGQRRFAFRTADGGRAGAAMQTLQRSWSSLALHRPCTFHRYVARCAAPGRWGRRA